MNIFGRMVERAKSEGQIARAEIGSKDSDIDFEAILAPLPSKNADQMRAQSRRANISEVQRAAARTIKTSPSETSSQETSLQMTSAQMTSAQKTLVQKTAAPLTRPTPPTTLSAKQDKIAVNAPTVQNAPESPTSKSVNSEQSSVQSPKTMAPRDEPKSDIAMANDYIETIRHYSRRTIEQQERSEARLRGLSGVLKQVELKLATFSRMEARLDAALKANKVLQGHIDDGKERSQMLELRIKTLEPQYVALRDTLETARIDLSTQRDVIRGQKEKLTRFNSLLSKAATRVAETDSRSASVAQAYKKLRSEFQEQTNDLSKKNRRLVDLEKGWDAMAKKLAVRNNDYEVMSVELKGLKNEHEDLKKRYLDASAAFENARYEFKSQITELKNKLLRRNEEYTTLNSHLESFKAQVEETGGISAFREREIVELKEAVEAERERVRVAESRMVDKAHLADMNGRALERAKFEYEVLNEKYATALSDIDMFKNMALSQNQKLSRYAAVSGSIDTEETKAPASRLAAIQSPKAQKSNHANRGDTGAFDPGFKARAFVTPSP